jgi:hypothetical protein
METASTFLVSENYFSVLGVGAVRGRTFAPEDFAKGDASPTALVSKNYWRKRFDGDAAVLGKTVRLNGVAVTIIGITPHNFVGTSVEAPDFWLPLSLEPRNHPDNNWLRSREYLTPRRSELSSSTFKFAASGGNFRQRTGMGTAEPIVTP